MREIIDHTELRCSCDNILTLLRAKQLTIRVKKKNTIFAKPDIFDEEFAGFKVTFRCGECKKEYLLVEPLYLMEKEEYERKTSKVSPEISEKNGNIL